MLIENSLIGKLWISQNNSDSNQAVPFSFYILVLWKYCIKSKTIKSTNFWQILHLVIVEKYFANPFTIANFFFCFILFETPDQTIFWESILISDQLLFSNIYISPIQLVSQLSPQVAKRENLKYHWKLSTLASTEPSVSLSVGQPKIDRQTHSSPTSFKMDILTMHCNEV